jgi:predicted signal transduction protein with EAL and GGDEF domain
MGGEEFIVISAHSDRNSLKSLGERIRLMVETQQPQTLNLTRLITVSIGGALSDLSLDEKGWGDTLKRSDQALYEAKTAGRNLFKLINDNNQRRHERFNQQAEIKVKIITPKREQEFVTAMENISKSGLFLRNKAEVQMVENDLVELQGAEFNDAKWQIAKVVRVTPQGFAIEFLSSSH